MMLLEDLKKEYWNLCAAKGDIVNKLELYNGKLNEVNAKLSATIKEIDQLEKTEKKESKDEDSGSK